MSSGIANIAIEAPFIFFFETKNVVKFATVVVVSLSKKTSLSYTANSMIV